MLNLLEAKNVVYNHQYAIRPPKWSDIPDPVSNEILDMLHRQGIEKLYTHQATAINHILTGKNVVVTTGVASGKSLCYQLPLLNSAVISPGTTSLLLFPTKALTQDQFSSLSLKITALSNIDSQFKANAGIYDGDTTKDRRPQIRRTAQFVFTNPDMLHLGILPHHTNWMDFFKNLAYVVVDELHVYRGIFGSHFTNLIRRLKRIAARYGCRPQFICTSATLENAEEFVTRLLEEPFTHISDDGSPSGERRFYLYNPPVVNAELGIRANTMAEAETMTRSAIESDIQTLVFTQSRRSVELIQKNLHRHLLNRRCVQGYRSGYLPHERREIENRLRSGAIKSVIATNALELGIDIGGLDLVIMVGYPGSIASTHQQAGRAGRTGRASEVILIATPGLLDQYILQHPDYLFGNSPEAALINPDNPFLLLNHIQCAAFEIPFEKYDGFGRIPAGEVAEYLDFLKERGKLHESGDKYFWISDGYPSDSISLRTAGTNQFILHHNKETIGIVDEDSAYWMVHPEAVYLHNAESYFAQSMDQEHHIVTLDKKELGYYTQAIRESEFELLELFHQDFLTPLKRYLGEIKVLNRTVGYKKIRWVTHEIIGTGDVDLPPTCLVTHGVWFSFPEETINALLRVEAWNNVTNDYGNDWTTIRNQVRERDGYVCVHCGIPEGKNAHHVHHKIPFKSFTDRDEANRLENLVTLCHSCHAGAETQVRIQSGLAGLSYLLRNLAPLFLMCDQSDIQVNVDPACKMAEGTPSVILYDSAPGGVGLSEKMYEILPKLLAESQIVVTSCICDTGCPACVGPVANNGKGSKYIVRGILQFIIDDWTASGRQDV